jgi:hypothetical protein
LSVNKVLDRDLQSRSAVVHPGQVVTSTALLEDSRWKIESTYSIRLGLTKLENVWRCSPSTYE